MQPIAGTVNATPPTADTHDVIPILVDPQGRIIFVGAGTAGTPSGGVQTTQTPADGATLTKASVTMTGSSGVLVAASASRLIVMVSSTEANAAAAIDPTGGTAALDAGIALGGGGSVTITGKAAQSAMTQIGTNTQKLTVYTG